MQEQTPGATETAGQTYTPSDVLSALDTADGVYLVVKDHKSTILWVNENFARLVGESKEQLIGKKDTRPEHVKDDQRVMAAGVPLLNYHEVIPVPRSGDMHNVPIITQKGLLREGRGAKVVGITVCFALQYPEIKTDVVPPSIKPGRALEHDADYWTERLGLKAIDLGGSFGSTFESDEESPPDALPKRFGGDRRFYSANYYLLKSTEVLRLHRLEQDEVWFHHQGGAFVLHIFTDDGTYRRVQVGQNDGLGDALQGVAPHGSWFGAEIVGNAQYGLAGCCLAPGFDPRDTRQPTPAEVQALRDRFPERNDIIDRLTK